MKFFVTGASGMLGTTLYDLYVNNGHEVVSTDLSPLDPWTLELDVRDSSKVLEMIKNSNPDYVLNLAALTDLEYCEENPQEAYDTNAQGAKNVAKACVALGIPMVHISTAGVFDGTKSGPHVEDDIPNPINVYGKSKHAGSLAVEDLLDRYFVFRAGWMMGSGARDKKFVRKVLNLIDQGHKTIYALTDMFGCPTYTKDFASGILEMVTKSDDYGLYHMVSQGHSSRYDVAAKMFEILDLDGIELVPVQGDHFKDTYYATRPSNEVMENKKLQDKGMNMMRDWSDALTEYLHSYYVPTYGKRNR